MSGKWKVLHSKCYAWLKWKCIPLFNEARSKRKMQMDGRISGETLLLPHSPVLLCIVNVHTAWDEPVITNFSVEEKVSRPEIGWRGKFFGGKKLCLSPSVVGLSRKIYLPRTQFGPCSCMYVVKVDPGRQKSVGENWRHYYAHSTHM